MDKRYEVLNFVLLHDFWVEFEAHFRSQKLSKDVFEYVFQQNLPRNFVMDSADILSYTQYSIRQKHSVYSRRNVVHALVN